jgi:hypothetical protein
MNGNNKRQNWAGRIEGVMHQLSVGEASDADASTGCRADLRFCAQALTEIADEMGRLCTKCGGDLSYKDDELCINCVM